MSLTSSHMLKQLQSQKTKLEEELKVINAEVNRVRRQQKGLLSNLNTINQKIKNMMSTEVILTEHAILRYLERVKGVNMEDVKDTILDDDTKSKIEVLGSGKFPKEGYTLVVKNNTIISIV